MIHVDEDASRGAYEKPEKYEVWSLSGAAEYVRGIDYGSDAFEESNAQNLNMPTKNG